MQHLILDTEQAGMMRAVFDLLDKLLELRAERADPDQHVSASMKLQRIKARSILSQLDQPPAASWSSMSASEKDEVLTLARALGEALDDSQRAALYVRLSRASLRAARPHTS